jgi:hypothetical protein
MGEGCGPALEVIALIEIPAEMFQQNLARSLLNFQLRLRARRRWTFSNETFSTETGYFKKLC